MSQGLDLPRGEPIERGTSRAASEDPGDDLRVEAGTPGRHLLHGVEELIAVEYAVLEEIAHPAAPVLHEFAGVEGFDVLREHQHRQPGAFPAGLDRDSQSFVGERRGQPDVHDGDVHVFGQQRPAQLGSGLHDRDDLIAQRLQHPAETIAQQELVLGNQHTHRSITSGKESAIPHEVTQGRVFPRGRSRRSMPWAAGRTD